MLKRKWIAILCFFCAACGKASFSLGYQDQTGSAPGAFSMPPKVDILLLQSNTGAIAGSFSTVNPQIQSFLNKLSSSNWNFHFASVQAAPSRNENPMFSQVAASQYDSNSPSYVLPYAGAISGGIENVSSSFFSTVANYQLMSGRSFNFASNSTENGFQTLYWTLQSGLGASNFLRPDALLVVFVVSETDDTSSVNYCNMGEGQTLLCEQYSNPLISSSVAASDPTLMAGYQAGNNRSALGTYAASFKYYREAFAKNWPKMSFYAAVSNFNSTDTTPPLLCNASMAYKGIRYSQMAGGKAVNKPYVGDLPDGLPGASFDICNGGISNAYQQLYASLKAQMLTRSQKYIFLPDQPTPSTIQVNRLIGGNSNNKVKIPQDAQNGWRYVGMQRDVAAYQATLNGVILNMNLTTGYAIELNGSGMITGSDLPEVIYQSQI